MHEHGLAVKVLSVMTQIRRAFPVLFGLLLAHVGTRQLAEAPAGRCWLLVTPGDMATTPAEAHADACDVEPGDRVYPGGALVDFWGNSSLSGGARDFHAEGVDCP
jgi:hypothetical protein